MSAETNKPARPSGAARRAQSFAVAMGLSVVAGFFIGGLAGITQGSGGAFGPPWVIALLAVIGMAIVGWVSLRWWRDIDELARQVHYSAWLWGGTYGMFAGWLLLSFLHLVPAPVVALLQGSDPSLILWRGGTVVVGAALVGYGLAWIIFWLRRR